MSKIFGYRSQLCLDDIGSLGVYKGLKRLLEYVAKSMKNLVSFGQPIAGRKS